MRLFYGIVPQWETKSEIWQVGQQLAQTAQKGNFTPKENLHLTLQYLGETHQLEKATDCLQRLEWEPFMIVYKGIGRFQRPGGDILWAGVEKSQALKSLNQQLRGFLDQAGFIYDTKPFRAHLTLARKYQPGPDEEFAQLSQHLPPCESRVDRVCLFHSHRVDGELVYTPVAEKRQEVGVEGRNRL